MKAATRSRRKDTPKLKFQSTPPVKAATLVQRLCQPRLGISIHAAREGGDGYMDDHIYSTEISIHAAREGGDFRDVGVLVSQDYFNPRRP